MSGESHRLFKLLGISLAVSLGLATAAPAETWRMPTKLPEESLEGQGFRKFADLVKQHSSGKLTVEIFPSEQLGKDAVILEQLQAGIVHVYPEGPDYLNKWVPDMAYVFAPFVFDNRDHWLRFMRSDLVKGWMAKVEKDAGIMVLGEVTAFMRGPYRVMSTKRPVANLAQMRGLKLRMFPNDLVVDAYTHLGAEVRVLGFTETYESIGRGVVEAVTLPITLVEPMKFYEVANHVVRTDEFHQSVAFMTNARAYRRLAPEIRAAVDRAHAEASAFSHEITNKSTEVLVEKLKSRGVKFGSIEPKEFAASLAVFYSAREKSGKLPAGFMAAVAATR